MPPFLNATCSETPRSLWVSPQEIIGATTRAKKLRNSSRVPVVRPPCVTWSLPFDEMRDDNTELWTSSEVLFLNGPVSLRSLQSVIWPRGLKHISFEGSRFNKSIAGVVWPTPLQKLSLGRHFNQTITGVVWPAALEKLKLGDSFNQPVAEVVWPASLKKLKFGFRFNQPIMGVVAGAPAAVGFRRSVRPAHRRRLVAPTPSAAIVRR